MKSYVIEFADGSLCEGYFENDNAAELWAETVFESRGFDPAKIVACDWQTDGENEDGQKCERMLFWANSVDAQDDPGANSFAKLCVVR